MGTRAEAAKVKELSDQVERLETAAQAAADAHKADAETAAKLQAENARLKADAKEKDALSQAEHARLKSTIAELNKENDAHELARTKAAGAAGNGPDDGVLALVRDQLETATKQLADTANERDATAKKLADTANERDAAVKETERAYADGAQITVDRDRIYEALNYTNETVIQLKADIARRVQVDSTNDELRRQYEKTIDELTRQQRQTASTRESTLAHATGAAPIVADMRR